MKAILLDVIAYIRAHQPTAPDALAERFGITRRTIRTYIRTINNEIAGIARITTARGEGYRIAATDPEALDTLLAARKPGDARESDALPQSGEERVCWLLSDLLTRNDWVTIEELAKTLYVSARTVSHDLRSVERQLASAGLEIEKKPHRGIRVIGPEYSRQLCLAAGSVISDEVWLVTGRMLDTVARSFRTDFHQDLELRINLARHIAPLITRLQQHLLLDNPLTEDIRKRFPLAWAMAFDASSVLADAYGEPVSDDEVAYLALAFALALERRQSQPVGKNVLVICASGAGTARLLEWRIRREFGEHIAQIRVCDAAGAQHEDLTGIDYIFSTVPLTWQPAVPVCFISSFLDPDDVQNVRGLLGPQIATSTVEARFSRSLFFANLNLSTRKEVIGFLCERIREQIEVPENFEELVWERERQMPTAMGGNVAMPHPALAVSERTFACVALLEHPIMWGSRPAQAIFLISVSRNGTDEEGLDAFYEVVSRLLISTEAIRELLSNPRFEQLVTEIRTIATTNR